MITLAELAKKLHLSFQGDGQTELQAVATLERAQPHQISFLANPKYTQHLNTSQAGAVILAPDVAAEFTGNALLSEDPYVTFAHVAQTFQALNQAQRPAAHRHPSAVVDATAVIGDDVNIGPLVVIGAGVQIGDGCDLAAHVSIAKNVTLGRECQLKAGVKIEAGCVLGERVMVHPGAVIGADGFGLARDRDGWVKIPQTGVVEIGDDCEIGANTTIDCGAIENTVLGRDVRLDNQIQIGHNVVIGDHTVIAGCTAVAGSAEIGKNCLIGGGVGIVGHIKICDGVTIQAMALVTHSITKPDSYSSVAPLQTTQQWRRNAVRTRQLDQIARRVKQLEKKTND
ncbi:UDP-3-O-(3-hydroxymyristoyl)glucosamine N-acyltransferase [Marinicella meishanensis]|uniref:UDP-3-O-(3-hydroxymyristoyl)glucosamine N-acyltransferase n=1 Tax=Marinicella meishanensis TaxID=2873263 RepID=UPI001CBE5F6F|nr:UDP-3-O-(3-hydroxymyristoyl)glucosamine N-acyltransferase [Marinicella sp. NBU2979]